MALLLGIFLGHTVLLLQAPTSRALQILALLMTVSTSPVIHLNSLPPLLEMFQETKDLSQ